MADQICTKCAKTFKAEDLRASSCKECGEPVPAEYREGIPRGDNEKIAKWKSLMDLPDLPPVKSSIKNSPPPRSTQSPLSEDTRAIIASQNRTTYAIRSLAMFFFISLQSSIVGGGLLGLALNNQSHYDSYGNLNGGATFFAALGAIIVLGGFFVAVHVGRQELNKSQP
jgi:hypothetical protein